jgi:hypothetical protein
MGSLKLLITNEMSFELYHTQSEGRAFTKKAR